MNIYQERRCIKVLTFLFDEIISACGDGNAWWYSTYYRIPEIEKVCDNFISKDYTLRFWTKKKRDHYLVYGHREEALIIIDTKEEFDNIPNWAQAIYIG